MNILLINGCTKECILDNETVQKITKSITISHDTFSLNNLYDLSLKPCVACDTCQTKTPGLCTIKDGLNELLRLYLASDLVILITPIIFGSCNAITKAFLDRAQPLCLPYQKISKNMMQPRYTKYPDIKWIGIAHDASEQSIQNFKSTFLNCSLSLLSKHRTVEIIHGPEDIKNIK